MSTNETGQPAPESGKTAALDRFLAFLATPRGITLLLTLWPVLLGVLGLPTGAAEEALEAYQKAMGTAPAVCECVCPPGAPAAPVDDAAENAE